MPKKYPFWHTKTSQNTLIKSEVQVMGEDIIFSDNSKCIDLEVTQKKLTKARTQLILDKPFLGNLVLRLPLKAAASWCKTTATDAKNFYYNPSFIEQLNLVQTKFVLIHEALHCALRHFVRRGHRQKHRWDLACDFAINPLLIKEGFHPPLDVVIFREYEGMLAEEIYPMIADKLANEPMDQHLYDHRTNLGKNSNAAVSEQDLSSELTNKKEEKSAKKSSKKNNSTENLALQPQPLTPDEAQDLAKEWQRHLASSAQLAKQTGNLTQRWALLVDFFLQPQISWRALLTQYVCAQARDDFSYYRTSRRQQGKAIMPSLRSEHIDIAVAVDTSGSISEDEINEFVGEISQIKSNLSANITLFACDDKLMTGCPWIYPGWQALEFPASLGGGKGTNFTPVFDYLNRAETIINVLVYFTDAQGTFPEYEPNYPVVWLVKGQQTIPWGIRVQLND